MTAKEGIYLSSNADFWRCSRHRALTHVEQRLVQRYKRAVHALDPDLIMKPTELYRLKRKLLRNNKTRDLRSNGSASQLERKLS
jgi:hypothetical protein